jgi:hypothetical protein
MLTLDNSGCQFIVANSEQLDTVISNPSDYSSIKIIAKKNCCDTVYTDTFTLDNTNAYWENSLLGLVGGTNITSLRLINIATGKIFETVSSPVAIPTPSSVSTNVDAILTPYLASLGYTFSGSTTTSITGGYRVNLSNTFPDGFAPIDMTLSYNGVSTVTKWFFGSSSTSSNIQIGAEGLIIGCLLFSDTTLKDGVYTISITTYQVGSGTSVTEQSCVFIDCLTSCSIASIIGNLDQQTTLELLMFHHGLIEGSNCSCSNCATLCDLYKSLQRIINTYSGISVTNNCSNC